MTTAQVAHEELGGVQPSTSMPRAMIRTYGPMGAPGLAPHQSVGRQRSVEAKHPGAHARQPAGLPRAAQKKGLATTL